MKCYQCSNEATKNILITGFDSNSKPKTTIVYNRCQSCVNSINDFMKRDFYERMRDAKNERESKKNKPKKKPSESQPTSCDQCYKSFKNDDTYYTLRWEGAKLAFCSKKCSSNYGEKLKQKEREYAESFRKKKEKQIEKEQQKVIDLLWEAMKNGEDISSFDFENVDWLDEEQKEICRKYVKNRKDVEELKRQRDNLEERKNDYSENNSTGNDNSSDNKNPCDECVAYQ
ncbi:MAG: hypothetical protein I3273_07045 [Candidatus Moeniiplasma glomeromycotorum]|nr:hypothetical protein [Candidatus Moeniiplasma glomeromycotorum]MCE8168296.1 hypothetical protein [Candidatus Moeniiplasma glomeromycotorum]MCE8169843.1 hypothetical protein [Candidatus Moeniiplasma glomeromycotorum]